MNLQTAVARSDSLAALCEQLRSERLLVASEQSALQTLNTHIQNELVELNKLNWTFRQERLALHRLINSDPSVSPDNCNQLIDAINASTFEEGHKCFSHHTTSISQIYAALLHAPRAMAEFLHASEEFSLNVPLNDLNRAIFNVVYGSCIFPQDEKQVLNLLAHLISLQLLSTPDPRRVLRKGNVTFSRMYRYFSEELSSAKTFLTAALHEPVMFLLSQDELFLDLDPAKSIIRFPSIERERRFGKDESSPVYKERAAHHRQHIVDRLVVIVEKFLQGIQKAMSCFPSSLIWLIRQLYTSLIERKHVTKDEAALICTDLYFTYFLCSSIVNPEPLGIISDTPISHISRFNLIQVGQVIQTLALLPYERPPAYIENVVQRFDQTAMPRVVRSILGADSVSLEAFFPGVVCDAKGVEVYGRRACAGTINEINTIHLFLKSSAVDQISDIPLRKMLKNHLKRMPSEFVQPPVAMGSSPKSSNGVPSRSNSSGKLRNLADRVQSAASKGHQRLMQNTSQSPNSRASNPRLIQSFSNNLLTPELPVNNGDVIVEIPSHFVVYFVPLVAHDTPIGLESEETIMANFSRLYTRKHKTSVTEKRTRFLGVAESVVSDRTTNTASDEDGDVSRQCHYSSSSSSDNDDLGASAAGGSSHAASVGDQAVDDIEDEDDVEEDVSTLPDNFSDGVPMSANVSARGSPSLSGGRNSGCDTPFSGNAPNDNSSTVPGAANPPLINCQALPTIPVTVRKQNPEGLEEKFGKFGLPPQDPSKYLDETYSLVSDSWSTDVVASDNEGFSESRGDAAPPHPLAGVGLRAVSVPLNVVAASPSLLSSQPNQLLPSVGGAAFAAQPLALLPQHQQLHQPSSAANVQLPVEELPYYDPKNLTQCRAFLDAKRKLRVVLCTASNIPSFDPIRSSAVMAAASSSTALATTAASTSSLAFQDDTRRDVVGELNEFLRMLLAESINARDRTRTAQIREVQRCLTVFDADGIRKLMRTLNVEHRKRTSYLVYLQQSKLTLLHLEYHLSRIRQRVEREKLLTAECLIEILVRFNMQRKEPFLREFVHEFQQLKAQDEKTDAVNKMLAILYDDLRAEPMWRYASPVNLSYTRKCMERALVTNIYFMALFPNGDADHCRDEVFHHSMKRLASTITISHLDLDIPKKFHGECPWPSAQAEIAIINAYKSPRDKVACVVRCCETIENLMALSTSDRAENASADDILPIIVYVLLQANPPTLLSNIQYVEDFYSSRMQGKEAYWWTQFTSSVEFIKQLLTKF